MAIHMEFASVAFIWIFLPAAILLFYTFEFGIKNKAARIQAQNIILLLFSLLFYLWGGFKALLLLVFMILFNFGFAIRMDVISNHEKVLWKNRKAILCVALITNILILAVFKYFNMLITLVEIILAPKSGIKSFVISLLKFEGTGAIHVQKVVMPLAISFIVFQSISYLIDVYKRRIPAERNLINFSLYIAFFAQLVQGPIERFENLGCQIQDRQPTIGKYACGIKRFCYGLGKKVLIANTIAAVSDSIWGMGIDQMGTATAWLGIVLYSLQIYYDFSGYSDMAVGIGLMFGFTICENFQYPYTSLSTQEFWRRWHISLSSWFRDYIYIPLGGNRKGQARTLLNLFIVFLVTGIWHGANLTFICWGVYFGFFNCIEKLFLGDVLKKNPIKIINWIYATVTVMMGWVLFRSPNLYYALHYYQALFFVIPAHIGTPVVSFFDPTLIIAAASGILLTGIIQRPLQPVYNRLKAGTSVQLLEVIICILIFVWSFVLITSGSYNPSIYGAF